jgi:hypothetical protein
MRIPHEILPENLDVRQAVEGHLEAFGLASRWMLRRFYPGVSLSTYARIFREHLQRPVSGMEKEPKLLTHRSFRYAKKISIDEAAIGLGDAGVCHIYSGQGRPIIGTQFVQEMIGLGLEVEDMPKDAQRGFLASSGILRDDGILMIPMYVGSGHRSNKDYVSDVAERWLGTWAPVFKLEPISGVTVLAHGLCSYDTGTERIRELSEAIARHKVGASQKHAALRRLNWAFLFVKWWRLPIGSLQYEIYRFRGQAGGRLVHTRGVLPGTEITEPDHRLWLWRPVGEKP